MQRTLTFTSSLAWCNLTLFNQMFEFAMSNKQFSFHVLHQGKKFREFHKTKFIIKWTIWKYFRSKLSSKEYPVWLERSFNENKGPWGKSWHLRSKSVKRAFSCYETYFCVLVLAFRIATLTNHSLCESLPRKMSCYCVQFFIQHSGIQRWFDSHCR